MTLSRLAQLPEDLQAGWHGLVGGTSFTVTRVEVRCADVARVTGRFFEACGRVSDDTWDMPSDCVVRRPWKITTGTTAQRNREFSGDVGEITERGFLSWTGYTCTGAPYVPGGGYNDVVDGLEDAWVRMKTKTNDDWP